MLTLRVHRAFILALAVLFITAFSASSAGAQASGQLDPRTDAFVAALDAAGFTVRPGSMPVTDLVFAVNNFVIDSGAGYNAGQFYKRWVVPPVPGQAPTAPLVFRLTPDEAVVYVGRTPPPGDYFSYTAFLWSRPYPDSYLPTGDWLFVSAHDPLNNAGIRTEDPSNPFEKNTIVVLTADEGVYERIRAAAASAGFPAAIVNPLVLPANLLRLGTDAPSDTFLVLVRTANIFNKAQEAAYLADDQWAGLYRLTPRDASPLQPFAQPPWRNRAGVHEETLVPGLQAGLERLKQAILAQTQYVQARPLESIQAVPDSQDILEAVPGSPAYRQYAAGESSDTPYRRSAENGLPANFLLGNEEMVVVYGVNHAALGIATYSSFAVYGEWQLNHLPYQPGDTVFRFGAGDPFWNGVVSLTHHEYAGSAEAYIQGDPMARYLYAVRVVRKARATGWDPYRVVVPEFGDSQAAPFYPDVIPLDRPAMIGYRAYLNPATGAGPAYEDLIPDRAIWFKLRPRNRRPGVLR
jgi:hypothetical protein